MAIRDGCNLDASSPSVVPPRARPDLHTQEARVALQDHLLTLNVNLAAGNNPRVAVARVHGHVDLASGPRDHGVITSCHFQAGARDRWLDVDASVGASVVAHIHCVRADKLVVMRCSPGLRCDTDEVDATLGVDDHPLASRVAAGRPRLRRVEHRARVARADGVICEHGRVRACTLGRVEKDLVGLQGHRWRRRRRRLQRWRRRRRRRRWRRLLR